jgi:hypothetical protein
MIDPVALQIVLSLGRQLGNRRLHLTDDDRRRPAARAHRVGRAALREIATIATPDTLLPWHHRLIARKWRTREGPAGVASSSKSGSWSCGWPRRIRRGYTRIQGALKNPGHRVGRSTIARILKAHGLPPVPRRPSSWQTFLKAPVGEHHFRRAVAELVAHYHGERNHQRLGNESIQSAAVRVVTGRVRRRPRLGGLSNFHERAA